MLILSMNIYFIGQKGLPCKSSGGGVERHLENLVSILKKNKSLNIFVYSQSVYSKRKTWNGIKLIPIKTFKIKWLQTPFYSFIASINVLFKKADIIHYQGIGPSLFLFIPKILSSAKIITTFHCRDYYHQKWGKIAKLAFRLGEFFACKMSDEIIVVSEELKEYVKNKYKRDSFYIPHPIIFKEIEKIYKTKDNKNILKKYNLKKYKYLLYAGRFVPHKKIENLILGYKMLPDSLKEKYQLLIIGAPSYTTNYYLKLKNLSKGENIKFLKWMPKEKLYIFYKFSKCFVYPSIYEGSSLSLIEASLLGPKIVAVNLKANKEILGKYGYYINLDSTPEEYFYIFKKILLGKMKSSKLEEKKLIKILKYKFDGEKVANLTLKLYKNLKFS